MDIDNETHPTRARTRSPDPLHSSTMTEGLTPRRQTIASSALRWLFIIIGNYVMTPLPNTRHFCMVLYGLGVLGLCDPIQCFISNFEEVSFLVDCKYKIMNESDVLSVILSNMQNCRLVTHLLTLTTNFELNSQKVSFL